MTSWGNAILADLKRAGRDRLSDPLEAVSAATKRGSAHTGRGPKRGMSRNEQRFAEWLDAQKLGGRLASWRYELLRVKLPAARATAVLDFVVAATGLFGFDSGLLVVEVKPRGKDGRPYFGPRGRLKVKLVAQALEPLGVPVVVAWPVKGGWNVETIPGSAPAPERQVHEGPLP